MKSKWCQIFVGSHHKPPKFFRLCKICWSKVSHNLALQIPTSLKNQLCQRHFPIIFCNTELEYYFRINILWGKNPAATIPAAPKVALQPPKLLQVPLIVLYLTKLLAASSGTFCEVQKLGGCCIGLRHWSKELPKFCRNGPGDI